MNIFKKVDCKKYILSALLFLASITMLSGCFEVNLNDNDFNNIIPRVTVTVSSYYEDALDIEGLSGAVMLQNTANQTGLAQLNIRKDANLTLSASNKSGFTFVGWYQHNPQMVISTQNEIALSVANYYAENVTEINFYAHFSKDVTEITEYQVEFNLSDSGIGQDTIIQAVEGSVIGVRIPSTPIREGFTFLGWNTASNGTGQTINASTVVTQNLVAYPIWTVKYYNITFNANGGQLNSLNSYQIMHNVALQQIFPENPQRENYSFIGWSTSSSDTGQTISETTVINNDATLYAIWQFNTTDYTITFDKQGGTGGTNTIIAKVNQFTSTVTAPTLTGWMFSGYYDQVGGQGTQYYIYTGSPNLTNVKAWDKPQNTTLYAKWTTTLTLYANGYAAHIHGNNNWTGEGTSVTMKITYNTPIILPVYGANGVTRTAYAFVEWNTLADGTGTSYSSTNVYTSTTKALYAQWSINYYQVTLTAGNGIDWVTGEGNYAVGQTVFIEAEPLLTYTFYRWSGDIFTHSRMYSFTMPAKNISIQAEANKTSYSITLNATGGTFSFNENITGLHKINDDGTMESFVAPIPVREGYLFLGWFNRKNGFGEKFETIVSLKKSYELFAHWQAYRQVTFVTNGGQNVEPIIAKPETRVPEIGNFIQPYKQGYRFMGWSTTNYENSTPIITIQFIENITEDVTLYAHWQILQNETYTVTFNSNGGSAVTNIYLQTGESLSLYSSMFMPSRRGYSFTGWFNVNNNQITAINNITSDLHLYAKWQIKTYTVSFSSQGGTTVSNIAANYGARVPYENIFSTPTRSGYVFRGWYTETDGKGVRYTHFPNLSKNISLYAYWIKESSNSSKIEQNYVNNLEIEKTANIFDYQGFINIQADVSIFRYGTTTSDKNGCGWIATYNLLVRLKNIGQYNFDISIADIIREYEYNGVINNGTWGTWPEAIGNYLEKLGLNANIYYNLGMSSFSQKVQDSNASIYGYIDYVENSFMGHYQTVYYEDELFYGLNPSFSANTLEGIKDDCLLYILITVN